MSTYIFSGLLLVVFMALYFVIVNICRKKNLKDYIENLIWGAIVLVTAIFLKGNYIYRLPSSDDTNYIIIIILVIIVEICYAELGRYYRKGKVYDWNVYLIRPTIIEMGLKGLVLPYLMNIPGIKIWFNMLIMGMTGAVLIIVACEILLNTYKGEYIGYQKNHYWSAILIGLLNGILTLVTESVLIAVLLRILFGILLYKKSVEVKSLN